MSRVMDVFHRPDAPPCALDGSVGENGPFEEVDPTVLPRSLESEVLICQQYVVFSATFRVPTFYFLLCDSSEFSHEKQFFRLLSIHDRWNASPTCTSSEDFAL